MFKKSQNSMEFVILASFMIFVFLAFFIVIQKRVISATEEKNDAIAQEIMNLVINEVKVAESVSDNYYRYFLLPPNLKGLPYNISIVSGVGGVGEIVIRYYGKEKVYFLEEYVNASSKIGAGLNNITKNNGDIFIRHMNN